MDAIPRSPSPCVPMDDPCPICLVDFHGRDVAPAVVKTRCGHRFDLGCISTWLDPKPIGSRRCAICRQEPLPLVREDGARIDEESLFCESLPLQACRVGDLKALQTLLALDSGLVWQKFRSAVSGDQIYLLYITAQNGHRDCLQALIGAGADLNAPRISGATPAYIAAQRGHTDCLQALIDAGADLNAALTSDGATPAFIAAENGHTDCLQALIGAGAVKRKKRPLIQ